MAANDNGSGRDPWGRNNSSQQGPPDIDEAVKKLGAWFNSLFGGGSSSGSSSGGGSGASPKGLSAKFLAIILVVVMGFWGFSGFYVVEQGESGVVLRFGEYTDTTSAGLRWHLPWPIETVTIINVQKINTVEIGYRRTSRDRQGSNTSVPQEALMLTADENIIDIKFAVQYDIKDPKSLLINVSDIPDLVVRQSTESAVRQIVGRNSMDYIITEGRADIAQQTRSLLQEILDRYDTGINIRAVEMQNAQPPDEVKAAFDDAVKAREDEVRLKNEAEAYANDVVPRARGAASRILQESEAYRDSTIARAEGEASRFNQILAEYGKSPKITRERLYLETMEQVFSNSSKLMIDQDGGNSLLYLPIDQLLKQHSQNKSNARTDINDSMDNNSLIGSSSSRSPRSTERKSRLSP